nr:MAG TPA: hypothetical protein [Microviridae sp.]
MNFISYRNYLYIFLFIYFYFSSLCFIIAYSKNSIEFYFL